jgi:hypothetical protein
VIHLYAIADELESLPDVEGIEGAPPERLRCDGFDLVVTEHDAKVEATEGAVLAHARVVEALLPLADALLPARFGLELEDRAGLEEAIQARATKLSASLDQVRGRVELGVRVVAEPSVHRPAETGRAYLEARREEVAVVDDVHEKLAGRARAATRGGFGGQLVLSGAYLVDPEAIPAFRDAVDGLETEHPQFTFALTGPWPPYSFAGVDEP